MLGIQLLKNKTRDPATRHLSRAKILREIEQRFAVDLARTIDKKFKDVNEKTQQILHRYDASPVIFTTVILVD